MFSSVFRDYLRLPSEAHRHERDEPTAGRDPEERMRSASCATEISFVPTENWSGLTAPAGPVTCYADLSVCRSFQMRS